MKLITINIIITKIGYDVLGGKNCCKRRNAKAISWTRADIHLIYFFFNVKVKVVSYFLRAFITEILSPNFYFVLWVVYILAVDIAWQELRIWAKQIFLDIQLYAVWVVGNRTAFKLNPILSSALRGNVNIKVPTNIVGTMIANSISWNLQWPSQRKLLAVLCSDCSLILGQF